MLGGHILDERLAEVREVWVQIQGSPGGGETSHDAYR